MFRRLANRVTEAVSSASSALAGDSRVSELAAMGFRESEATHALRECNGDMTRATEWLLSYGSPIGTAGNPITIPETITPSASSSAAISQEDSELQRAIQASLKTENEKKNKATRLRAQTQSAASKNAGKAAASRTKNKLSAVPIKDLANTHPKVQMPKRISQHDQEDIIMRCANRVAPYSLSVDTLLRSLKTIQGNPSIRKYHTVDMSSAMFQRSLNAPGVLDFLKAVNFHPNYNNHKILTLSHFDPAAFYLGISSMEQIQQNSIDYKKDKALRVFQKDLASALSEKRTTAEELSERTKLLSLLSSEPTTGGSRMTIEYGIILNNNKNEVTSSETLVTKVTRGFDHDDTLNDVLHWLGGQSTTILEKLESGEWNLVDRNRQGPEKDYYFHKLDLQELKNCTLQYVGCWPSGRLAIVPKLAL